MGGSGRTHIVDPHGQLAGAAASYRAVTAGSGTQIVVREAILAPFKPL